MYKENDMLTPEVLNMDFKDKLQAIRAGANMSQEQMAAHLGVSRQAVAKWEAGQSYPDIENLLKISDLLKLSLDRLLRPEGDECGSEIIRQNKSGREELIGFLCRAKKLTYAGKGREEEVSCRPASHDLKYAEGKYLYIDTYLGGERFSGQEAVWQDGTPLWTMNYCGRVLSDKFSGDFLKEALALVSIDMPYRGPAIYNDGDYGYHCAESGDFEWFSGLEEVYCAGVKTMECLFHGGVVR